ncbi:MAG: chromosomal replication initiator protein DnaA [Microthrixaceae bacterium]
MTSEASRVWAEASAALAEEVSDATWNSTFLNLVATDLVDGVLTFTVPSQLVKSRIESRFLGLIDHALESVGHSNLTINIEVEIDISPSEPDPDHTRGPVSGSAFVGPADESSMEPRSSLSYSQSPSVSGLVDDRYTFETFVTGPTNRFPHAAALSVAENPARAYNPFLIYGSAGLGKTHLLLAIANYVREIYPTYTVRYISSETMLNEFVEAIRQNSQAEFKRKFREIDVLLVDDIQFMEGKEQLQEEFFHTFNTLQQAQKQIVLSSDRPPDAIAKLEDRLRSRFKQGLITDIQPPDFETRLAILQKKQEHSGARVPDEILEFIATHVTYNIRELEGALTKICAYISLNNVNPTLDVARDVLADSINSTKPRQITASLIIEKAAELFAVEVQQILGKSRTRDLVHARQIGMYVCRTETDLSFPQIGKEFGNRDHSTVMHSCEKIANLMSERHKTYDDVVALTKMVRARD